MVPVLFLFEGQIMSIEKIGLSKLLKIFGADDSLRRRLIREDLYRDRKKLEGFDGSGGDFYVPFWADAKSYVTNGQDLHIATKARIEDLRQRASLYPRLRDGFLEWLELSRRDTNQKLVPSEKTVHARHDFPEMQLTLKIDNVMALHVGNDRVRLVYPYFCKEHGLSERWGRVGIWLMKVTFPAFELDDMEIVDVMRGRSIAGRRGQLVGDEEQLFKGRYALIHDEWEALKPRYGLD